ncbi:SEC-C domain-containing protein [Rhodococcus opacus]|nr:SEC-C domain-containing protein [Rhodococcus opacus]
MGWPAETSRRCTPCSNTSSRLPGRGWRNHPCWCGSGKKYKTCHLGKGDHPLSERAAWLYQKAKLHAEELGWRDQIFEFAEIRSEYWAGDAALSEALDDPLVADVALFEGGAFTDFVDSRGDLLPADEFALARQWQEVERSVHEVEEVRPGEGLTLRDLRTGDRREIRERAASRQLGVGNLICARVVPAGDTWQIFGGIEPISPDQRAPLVEALNDDTTDPADLVEILSERFAPVRG